MSESRHSIRLHSAFIFHSWRFPHKTWFFYRYHEQQLMRLFISCPFHRRTFVFHGWQSLITCQRIHFKFRNWRLKENTNHSGGECSRLLLSPWLYLKNRKKKCILYIFYAFICSVCFASVVTFTTELCLRERCMTHSYLACEYYCGLLLGQHIQLGLQRLMF